MLEVPSNAFSNVRIGVEGLSNLEQLKPDTRCRVGSIQHTSRRPVRAGQRWSSLSAFHSTFRRKIRLRTTATAPDFRLPSPYGNESPWTITSEPRRL